MSSRHNVRDGQIITEYETRPNETDRSSLSVYKVHLFACLAHSSHLGISFTTKCRATAHSDVLGILEVLDKPWGLNEKKNVGSQVSLQMVLWCLLSCVSCCASCSVSRRVSSVDLQGEENESSFCLLCVTSFLVFASLVYH